MWLSGTCYVDDLSLEKTQDGPAHTSPQPTENPLFGSNILDRYNDPGFEKGVDGSTVKFGWIGSMTVTNTDAHTGLNSMKIPANSFVQLLSEQTYVPGAYMRVGGFFKNIKSPGSLLFTLVYKSYSKGIIQINPQPVIAADWTEIYADFQLPNAIDIGFIDEPNGLQIKFWNGSGDEILVDDLYVKVNLTTPTPKPTATPTPTPSPTPTTVNVTGVRLNKTTATIKVVQTLQLKAVITPNNATNKKITWKSSNTKVVTVSSTGKLVAKKPGVATITATSVNGNKSATCKVKVVQPVTSVKLNKSSVLLKKGKSIKLIPTINPSNATNKKVTWKSSNKAIVTVTSTGTVKGIKKGTTYIYVYTVDGKKSARCKVVVSN